MMRMRRPLLVVGLLVSVGSLLLGPVLQASSVRGRTAIGDAGGPHAASGSIVAASARQGSGPGTVRTRITHTPPGVFSPGRRIQIKAGIADPSGISVARCYFRAVGEGFFVFVDMQAGPDGSYSAILPAAAAPTRRIDYIILAVNGDKAVVRTQTFALGVDASAPAGSEDRDDDGALAVKTEVDKALTRVPGFSDSVTMDVVESGLRFGYVVQGIYLASQMTGAAPAGYTAAPISASAGAAPAGSPGASNSASSGAAGTGKSAMAWLLPVAGAAAGAAAVVAATRGGDDGSPGPTSAPPPPTAGPPPPPPNRTPVAGTISASGAGGQYTFSVSGWDDADGDNLTFAWNFGDGTTLPARSGQTSVSHSFTRDGAFTVQVTLSDGRGGTASTSMTVNVTITISGRWVMSIRCQGQSSDVASVNLTLNQTSGGAFSGQGSGTDYNGAPFTARLTGQFVAATGAFSGQLRAEFSNSTRIDNFQTTLRSNDTGYFPISCVQNCGCPGELRMRRTG
jgi:PKD repeat protein